MGGTNESKHKNQKTNLIDGGENVIDSRNNADTPKHTITFTANPVKRQKRTKDKKSDSAS